MLLLPFVSMNSPVTKAQEPEKERYNGWYNTTQGVDNFYYVYTPGVYSAASKSVTYDFTGKGDCVNVNWAAGRTGWSIPGKSDYADMPFVYDDWFFVHKTSTEYAYGMEFRAPAEGYYYVDAMIAGGDSGMTLILADKNAGDGFIGELVVNNQSLGALNSDNEFKQTKGDYWSVAPDMQFKQSSFNLSRVVYLKTGETATLYIHAKTSNAYDSALPRMAATYLGDLGYTHEYIQFFSTDYTDMAFKPVYANYDDSTNTVDMLTLGNLIYTTTVYYDRTGWRIPGQETSLPMYSSWGDYLYADHTKALGFEFTAPENGIYDFSVFMKGGDGYAQPAETDPSIGDGYGMQIVKDGAVLNLSSTDNVYCALELDESLYNNAFQRIELSKGEQVYVMYTALANVYGDASYPTIKVKAALNVPPDPELQDPENVYKAFKMDVGDTVCVGADSNSTDFNAKDGGWTKMAEQAEYNFYYMYGIPNSGGLIDISGLKQARPVNKSIKALFSNLEYTNLCPRVEDMKLLGGGNVAGFFGYTYDGSLGSSDMFYPAIRFIAPETGRYRAEFDLSGGNRVNEIGEFYENTNGMQWRIYDKDHSEVKAFDYSGRASTVNDSAYSGDNYKTLFDLKKGECITLLCDNNGNARWDSTFFSFKVTRLAPDDDGYERGLPPTGTDGKTVRVENTDDPLAMKVVWDKIPNATGYRIQLYAVANGNISTSPYGVGLAMDDGFETENDFITVYELESGTDYYFQVVSLNGKLATAAYSVLPLKAGTYRQEGTGMENESGDDSKTEAGALPKAGDSSSIIFALFLSALCCAGITFGALKKQKI